MNIPSAERNPAQGRIPKGTKRVVIFDTNAYRNFAPKGSFADSRATAIRLRQCEQAAGVFILASPTVIWELTAHLADPKDRFYNQCLKSLVIIGEHAMNPANLAGGLSLFPDSESSVCRELFHCVSKLNENGVRNLGSFVRHVSKNAPDLSDQRAQENIRQITSQVDAAEKNWLKSMQPVLERCDPTAAKQFFGNIPEMELRKKMRDFFVTPNFVDMWAGLTVLMHAAKVGYTFTSEVDLNLKKKIVLDAFPVPVKLMSSLLQKIAMDQNFKLGDPDKKRWNYIWDNQLTFSIGKSHQVADAPLYFVTSDGEVINAAKDADCQERVLALPDYLKSVGFN